MEIETVPLAEEDPTTEAINQAPQAAEEITPSDSYSQETPEVGTILPDEAANQEPNVVDSNFLITPGQQDVAARDAKGISHSDVATNASRVRGAATAAHSATESVRATADEVMQHVAAGPMSDSLTPPVATSILGWVWSMVRAYAGSRNQHPTETRRDGKA